MQIYAIFSLLSLLPFLGVAVPTTSRASYIITLKPNADKGSHITWLANRLEQGDRITHGGWNSTFIHAFAATLSPKVAALIRAHPEVVKVEEDGVAFAYSITSYVCQD
jgi:hypothetical protein